MHRTGKRYLAEVGAPVGLSQDEMLACSQAILRTGNPLSLDPAMDERHKRVVNLQLLFQWVQSRQSAYVFFCVVKGA